MLLITVYRRRGAFLSRIWMPQKEKSRKKALHGAFFLLSFSSEILCFCFFCMSTCPQKFSRHKRTFHLAFRPFFSFLFPVSSFSFFFPMILSPFRKWPLAISNMPSATLAGKALPPERTALSQVVQKCLSCISVHLHETISLDLLFRHCGLCGCSLSIRFKEEMHMGIPECAHISLVSQ